MCGPAGLFQVIWLHYCWGGTGAIVVAAEDSILLLRTIPIHNSRALQTRAKFHQVYPGLGPTATDINWCVSLDWNKPCACGMDKENCSDIESGQFEETPAWVVRSGACQGWPPGVRMSSSSWQTAETEGWRLFDQVINNPCLQGLVFDEMSHVTLMTQCHHHLAHLSRSLSKISFYIKVWPRFPHSWWVWASYLMIYISAPSLQSWSWYRHRSLHSPGLLLSMREGNDTIRVLSH